MDIYSDIKSSPNKKLIEKSIKTFGCSPEHNYHHFLYHEDVKNKCYFFHFGKNRGVLAILNKNTNVWRMLAEVLSSRKERIWLFQEFLDYALNKKMAKKVVVEAGNDFKREIISHLQNSEYRVCKTNYCLHWPVYDVDSLPKKLPGKKWKKLRNIRNRFKKYRVAFRNAKNTQKKYLKEILSLWLKRRPRNDIVNVSYYENAIKNNFEGFDIAKSIYINGTPCSISGGWQIPNTKMIYYGIGIQNYKYNNVSEFANLRDLMEAKNRGYRHVDLGGSHKTLLSSKRKLNPENVYKSYVFSIVKK